MVSSTQRRCLPAYVALTLASLALAGCSLERAPSGEHAQRNMLGNDGGGAQQASVSGQGGGGGSGGLGSAAAGSGGAAGTSSRDAGLDGTLGSDASELGDATLDAAPQGYEPGLVGAPCTADSECHDDSMDRSCFAESAFAPLLTLPGGYCGKLCDPSLSSPCEAGAACITFPTFPPLLFCMRACTTDGDCRQQDGYSCNKPGTSNTSVCSLRN